MLRSLVSCCFITRVSRDLCVGSVLAVHFKWPTDGEIGHPVRVRKKLTLVYASIIMIDVETTTRAQIVYVQNKNMYLKMYNNNRNICKLWGGSHVGCFGTELALEKISPARHAV